MNIKRPEFDYNPQKLPRELKKHYISLTPDEINQMLKEVGLKNLEELYVHIPKELHHKKELNLPTELNYEELANHVYEISLKNNIKHSFLGDGLQVYKTAEVVPFICGLRGLTTAYTPYQPERSQGTLQTLWIYQSQISALTGFEAINASMYDRSTALFEAMNTATRLVKESDTILVSEGLFPQDIEVLKTHCKNTNLKLEFVPVNKTNGQTDITAMNQMITNKVGGIVFPHVNCIGVVEDVDALTDIATNKNVQSIAVIDPMLLATGGLKAPSTYGSSGQGASMIVGEGQHLAIGPNFGGPGLGIFGIRYNDSNKNSIRATAGRFVGKGKDITGKDCKLMVLSTREQHIRREKANSNICSNQSYIATIAGASLLEKGETGTKNAIKKAFDNAHSVANKLIQLEGVELKFPTGFFNEFTLKINQSVKELIKEADKNNLQIGIDVSNRIDTNENLLLISFSDIQTEESINLLIQFFSSKFKIKTVSSSLPEIKATLLRTTPVNLKGMDIESLKKYYSDLASQNVSPDDNIYPLGSCTMKYNPYINDYCANFDGFTKLHPQAPIEDAQGALEIIYYTQEYFKEITGLAAVTTQPVAGAQGEYVGIKMFQAYHEKNGENQTRNIILIPASAHGTNPATATVAGYETKEVDGIKYGIVTIEADQSGQMDLAKVTELVKAYNKRISGIMVTNPNTSGIFETNFKKIADLIHDVGGLVYMDGANMNAIAGWIDLGKMGVDAVHNNTHKTWSIPHGGGGPGDAFVAVSEKLVDFLPGVQVIKNGNSFSVEKSKYSIGSVHRHYGNFAHKVRAYTYLRALGKDGVKQMSAVAVLSARYLYHKLSKVYPTLPAGSEKSDRMHEFIITLPKELFTKIEQSGTPKNSVIAKIGKLFLDFGMHAPTVAFPEIYGLMIEPTESYSKKELDRFCDVVTAIYHLVNEHPEILKTAPHFTPIQKVDEVEANKNLVLSEKLNHLSEIYKNKIDPKILDQTSVKDICTKILAAHKN